MINVEKVLLAAWLLRVLNGVLERQSIKGGGWHESYFVVSY
jgi:hypothetical protein